MTRPIAMARFDLGWPLAGAFATVLSGLVLGALAAARGLPAWAPLNATTHALYGPEVTRTALDLGHTGLGAAIHVAACFFWSAVAVLLIRRAPLGGSGLAWIAGLGTATMAGLVDYGLLPARLSPGWELVLPPLGVAAGLAAMGVGMALGLMTAAALGRNAVDAAPRPRTAPATGTVAPRPEPPISPVEQLRRPAPQVLDQRQQRIDPADMVTEDPNRLGNGMKQPGDPETEERPDR